MKSWETTDPDLLTELRQHFQITSWYGEGIAGGGVGLAATNSIEIELSDGVEGTIYIFHDYQLGFQRTDKPQGFHLQVDTGFAEKLREVIEAETREIPHFQYRYEVTVVQE